ncbi:unnamed protein product [Microthlaspi erraticum]|uniref:glutathione transferase n=1 Tax=Microthlaspi erraticum TaxID=1685480 RepID=A0A6D2KVN1_9BRAS|nr:unnamed protein product [Microthlaspi erraticum]
MGVNASDVPTATTCDHYCNQTLESRHKDGGVNNYIIYGFPYSTNTWRALAVLNEKGLPYTRIKVDLRSGEQKKQPFLSINPFGQVPVLKDGEFKLAESRAISEYLETAHRSSGSQLLDHESYKTMGTQKMWIYIESFKFDPPSTILNYEQAIKPLMGLKTDYKLVNETVPKLEKVLDVYEERLKNSSFLAGESFTLADLYHLPNIQNLMGTPSKILFETRPSVHRWVANITARPAWKKACDVNW